MSQPVPEDDLGFDPFHRWLGIPPSPKGVDHYRVLGLQRFESDREVILDAVDRQLTPIRRYLKGKHAKHAQRILEQISIAKDVLIDDVQRRQYDEDLRHRIAHEERGRAPGNSDNSNPTDKRQRQGWLLWSAVLVFACGAGASTGVILGSLRDPRPGSNRRRQNRSSQLSCIDPCNLRTCPREPWREEIE